MRYFSKICNSSGLKISDVITCWMGLTFQQVWLISLGLLFHFRILLVNYAFPKFLMKPTKEVHQMFVAALLWGHFVEVGTASIERNQLSDNSP